jgi:hypothetical protein
MRPELGLIGCCLIVLSGCNAAIYGTWKTVSVSPNEATKAFNLATATFNSDNTFTAVSQYGKEKKTSQGTYFFDGFKLKLKTKDGKERVYNCMKVWDKLEVTQDYKDQKIKLVMAQQP